jgi:hypothetical protein
MSGIACMACRKEIALINAGSEISEYECKKCGLVQWCLHLDDGIDVWRKAAHNFNGWVHGTVE